MVLDIRSGSVLYNTALDEIYLVIRKAVAVDAWQCFTVDPRVHGWIRTYYVTDKEEPIWEQVGHVSCRDPEIWTDILKKGASGLKTLRAITDCAKERLYSNELNRKPKRLLRGSLIFQED